MPGHLARTLLLATLFAGAAFAPDRGAAQGFSDLAAGRPVAGRADPTSPSRDSAPAVTEAVPPDGDREAGPDPAAALLPGSGSLGAYPPGPAPTGNGIDWGLGTTPEQQEVDVEALPDVPMAALDPAFPIPGEFRDRVDFWKFIYSGVGMYELVVHDTLYMDRVYEIVAMPTRPTDWKAYLRVRKATLRRAQTKYRTIIRRLAAATPRTKLTAEEERVRALLADLPGAREKYREAARRVHGQAGMRDRFLDAVAVSDAYLPEMERVFRERNLPVELTRLPFVESGFNPHASSKARAVGVWQFIKSTGRRFDLVTHKKDMRRDVTASTIAAAKLLSYNYRETGSWPLALMAYHHGLGGVRRAVRVTGTTDVDHIVRTYKGRRFKYASRNYYAQFVAVNELHAEIERGRGRSVPPERVLDDFARRSPIGTVAGEAGALAPATAAEREN